MSEGPTPENQRQEREWLRVWREFLNHTRLSIQENQRREQELLRTQKKAIFEAIYVFVGGILVITAATSQLIVWIITKTAPWYDYAGMIAVDILCIPGLITYGKKLLVFGIRRYRRRRMPATPEEEPRRE
ncbi:MAG: hypothetical protein ACJ8AG_13825 [Ktedonobacteraceae bacterium]